MDGNAAAVGASITYRVERGSALIQMDNPPLNGLSWALRQGLLRALDQALADPAVVAIVLSGSVKAFSCGADVKEFGTPQARRQPALTNLIRAFEDSPKPVVAAISGMALGGGLELAMGCHFRVAVPGADMGLPEIKLGLMPGAGGTQRLPRLAGLNRALSMILTGASVKAAELADTPLVDEIAEKTRQDPVAYRMKLMGDQHPRHRAALQLAVDKSGYGKTALPAGAHWGVAVHESFESVVAYVVAASVKDGKPVIHSVTAGVHCNLCVNPRAVEAQVQGSAIMALSTTLPGHAITFKDGMVQQGNYHEFAPARLTDAPDVAVHIVPSNDPPSGMGVPGLPPFARALAYAVRRATGKAQRALPLQMA